MSAFVIPALIVLGGALGGAVILFVLHEQRRQLQLLFDPPVEIGTRGELWPAGNGDTE